MSEMFYVRIRGRVQGPFELDKLRTLAKRGQFSRAHQVSTDGAVWQQASEFPDLFAAPAAAPTATAAAAQPVAGQPAGNGHAAAIGLEPVEPQQQQQWYYAKGESQFGPVDMGTLRQLAASGQLRPEDPLWCAGMSNWATAESIAGLSFGAPPVAANIPAESPAVSTSSQSRDKLNPAVIRAVARSPGWVTFIGVCSLVYGALCVVGGLFLLLASVDSMVLIGSALGQFIYAGIFITAGILLLSYGGDVRDFLREPTETQLAVALHKLQTFWVFFGMVVLVTLLLVLLVVLLVVLGLIGVAAALS